VPPDNDRYVEALDKPPVFCDAASVDCPPNGSEPHPKESRPGPVWIAEYFERPELLAAPVAIVPRLLYPGRVMMLSAREKVGKSTLLAQACAALTVGGEFLGDKLKPAVVLWYAIDELLDDTVRRFKTYGVHPDRLAICEVPPTALEMQAHIEETDAAVVVVDTLTELWGGRKIDENQASEVAPRIRPYIDVARSLKVALGLLHHTSRGGVEYRGSVHLGAAVDIIVTLRPVKLPTAQDPEPDDPTREDSRRLLIGKGRGVHFHERLSFDRGRYVLGEAVPSLRGRILKLLLNEPESATSTAAALRVRKETIVEEFRLLDQEAIVRRTADGKKYELTPGGRLSAAAVP